MRFREVKQSAQGTELARGGTGVRRQAVQPRVHSFNLCALLTRKNDGGRVWMMADFLKYKTKYALGFQSITSNQGELEMGSRMGKWQGKNGVEILGKEDA